MFIFFFFFQAEDGIRDLYVTGVQTCALPICRDVIGGERALVGRERAASWRRVVRDALAVPGRVLVEGPDRVDRSEERRVGKECRSRWWRDHEKKKVNMSVMGERVEGDERCV